MPLDPTSFTRLERVQKVVDGDGDGWVYDGTPKKRPATPAEAAAGRALRAKKGVAGAKKAPAAKKAAAPKNDYDKRVAKFERAINQAIRSGDKKQIKQVHDLIGQDFILKKPDRDRLQQVLAARRDGKPGPALPKAPAAAKKAPAAKKVAEKKPARQPVPRDAAGAPAKKAAAPKKMAAPPKKDPDFTSDKVTERNGVPVGRKTANSLDRLDAEDKAKKPSFRIPGPKEIAGEYSERIKAAKTDEEVIAVYREMDDDKRLSEVWKRALRHDIRARREELRAQRSVQEASAARPRPANRMVTDAKPSPSDVRRRISERAAAAGGALKRRLAGEEGASFLTTHGPKTRAWKRHAERDIANARTFRDLKGRMTQVNNALRDKRITAMEADELKKKILQRLGELGLDANGNPKRANVAAPGTGTGELKRRIAAKKAVGPKPERTLAGGWKMRVSDGPVDGAETKAYEAIAAARDKNDTKAIRAAAMEAHDAMQRGELARKKLDQIEAEAAKVLRRIEGDRSFQRKAMENARIKIDRRIEDASTVDELMQIRGELAQPQNKDVRDWFRENPSEMKKLNERFKAKKEALENKTIQPKMPPGAGRARAKANLPSDWAQKINAAAGVSDVEKLMSDLEKVPVSAISKDEFNKIAEALNDRMAELDAAGANFNDEPFEKALGDAPAKKVAELMAVAYDPSQINALLRVYEKKQGPDLDAIRQMADERHAVIDAKIQKAQHSKLQGRGVPSRSEAGVDNSAEAMLALSEHFSGGGKIEDAPVNGLWNYLQVSERFTVSPKSGISGITPKFTVTDHETGEKWWVKADWTPMAVVEHGAMKEQWGGLLMEGMGINAPKVKMGQNGEVNDDPGVGKFMMVQDAGEALFGEKGLAVQDLYFQQRHVDGVKKGKGAGGYQRLHLLDYIMDNNDRHGANVMGIDGPGGPNIALLDFGLGMGYWRHQVDPDLSPLGYLSNKSRRDSVGDAILQDPDSAKHMAQVQAELRKVRVDAIVEQMIANGQDRKQARLWGESMSNRIDKILAMTPDQLVQMFSRN